MSTEIHTLSEGSGKTEQYENTLPQLQNLLKGETDLIARVSSAVAVLKDTFGFLWVGCYFVKENELVIGPYQGPLACTRIGFGKGVCGTSWKSKQVIIVPNVDVFPGHIACSSLSKSEIVIPSFNKEGDVNYVLDVDSKELNTFDETDKKYLLEVVKIINTL